MKKTSPKRRPRSEGVLSLFSVFHLNLMYSSIGVDSRSQVIQRCYHPLLDLAENHGIPIAVEAPAITLELVEAIDPRWIGRLRSLIAKGKVEFVGSGYTQLIAPLAPARVNEKNLELGHEVYQHLLGVKPIVGLVNEQAWSDGLIPLYRMAGYKRLLMEWDNARRNHPGWDEEKGYRLQRVTDGRGNRIELLWNQTITFQKFQRYAHDELTLDEILDHLRSHVGTEDRLLSLYGNDVEIFDYRPGRYATEPQVNGSSEWKRIEKLYRTLAREDRIEFVLPSAPDKFAKDEKAVRLATAGDPILVKKQPKYNITRWAVSGWNDQRLNTRVANLARRMDNKHADESEWKRLLHCYSSDYRTHVAKDRFTGMLRELVSLEKKYKSAPASLPAWSGTRKFKGEKRLSESHSRLTKGKISLRQMGRWLQVRTPVHEVQISLRRGLAFGAWGKRSATPLAGTLEHGYYRDIHWGADFYTGHLVFDRPGHPKLTDLNRVDPLVSFTKDSAILRATMPSILGPIHKQVRIFTDQPRIEIGYALDWKELPVGSLRLGHLLLIPDHWKRSALQIVTNQGGGEERIPFGRAEVNHGQSVSAQVSALSGFAMSENSLTVSDGRSGIRMEPIEGETALMAQLTHQSVGQSWFGRLAFSARELDETIHPLPLKQGWSCRIAYTLSDG